MIKRVWMIALLILPSSAHAGLVCYEYQYAPNLVQAVQTVLKQQSFYAGPVDGKWGPKTKEAVHKFQVSRHIRLQPSSFRYTLDSDEGELEPQTLKALFGDKAPTEGVSRVPNPHGAPSDIWAEQCR